ncbi:hypothetical protein P170DRAFT_130862 [Aspergillus steynii IBT 23096]|uniref:Membrane anchor Opy2 N-terminal domain-containing protein n=1 Tax=Aspergillus steynii IBT 23096 TaxID=1392250 RepID=A0A2I2GKQ8_9EURO|nr:uncharacterized protein P170DRAFT_130862 [Aspergillus steynii IBT 23096]PLB53464.1 hypothetical protein P170DRAFT_130862 [Aspergillus steynii IBT 23096]
MASSFSPNALSSRSIFKRCVKCSESAPACPSCEDGYTCTMVSQSCDQCATTKCIPTSANSSNSGGWFFIRKKRKEYAEQAAADGEKSSTAPSGSANPSRKSTHSIASTVLTRASNVIQIAYIPGVTNRSPPETPLVPPVPPLPGAAPDQHFFMPGDLRDSSWSDMTTQERQSIAPSLRSSVATTIYRNNAIVSPMPAQQVMRTRAAVVSIHNGPNDQPQAVQAAPDAPAVPAITQAQLAKANANSSIVARTMMAKPVMVRGSSKKKNVKKDDTKPPAVQTISEQSEPSASTSQSSASNKATDQSASGFDASSSEDEDDKSTSASNTAKPSESAQPESQSRAPTVIEDSPATNQGPFTDQPTEADARTSRTSSHLETNDGTRSNRSSRVPPPRVESPFSDANEVK